MDTSSYTLQETVKRLVKAPNVLADLTSTFTEYMIDNIIRDSAPVRSILDNVMILQAHMGVTLFRQQRHTSRLLAGFVYKTLVPDEEVPKDKKFRRCYRITNDCMQMEYSQVFQHKSKVVTMQFERRSMTEPSVAMDLIKRELDRVSTSWELTRTMEVLRYCTAQPTLTDMLAQRTNTSSRADKLDAILVMAELMCGLINIEPDYFFWVLKNILNILSDKPKVIIMGDTLLHMISDGMICTQIVSEDTKITPEFSLYTRDEEEGKIGEGYEFTMQQVTRYVLGEKDLTFTNESCFQDSSIDMKVNYIRVGGYLTKKIPIVHVDKVQLEYGSDKNTSTEYKAFSNPEGFKWEYFTVGCMAPALNQINPSHLLSTVSQDINYNELAQRSPSASYLHQYNDSVACVSLRSLHPMGNPKELFTHERRMRLQNDVNVLMRADPNGIPVEKLACLAHSRDWYSKIKNPASLLEFDTRNMVVPRPPDNPNGQSLVPKQWVVRPRVALFNSSPMNNIDNEIAQIGSELLTHFGNTESTKQVVDYLNVLQNALHWEHGVESMIEMRNLILEGRHITKLGNPNWTKGRLYWFWLTDPICAVHIQHVLKEKEKSLTLTPEELEVLVKIESFRRGLNGLFKGIVGNRNNSVMASMPVCFNVTGDAVTDYGYPKKFNLDDVDYCNLMYWIILPVLGARVYRLEATVNGGDTVCSLIQYREKELNLTKELNLPNESALTVMRLNGTCAFTKVALRNGVDVSELFEPTALTHKRCTDTGFNETSIITYIWAIRLKKLSGICNNLARVLLGMHYSTLLTHNVIQDHYDTKYYSGMSYLLFRGVRFTGCGISLMPQKSALYTLGSEVISKPTSQNMNQVHTVNQCCQSVVIPETKESLGVYIPNLYMNDIQGGNVQINKGSPFDMVVADAFNGFCPESNSTISYHRPYIYTTGRSDRLNGCIKRDPMMRAEAYTCMPTLLRPFSSVLSVKDTRRHGINEDSNHKLFCNTRHIMELEGVINLNRDLFKSTVDRVNEEKRTTDIMQPMLGVAFCGTYSIGLTSNMKIMCVSDMTRETPTDMLAPRISGTGLFPCKHIEKTTHLINPIFNRIIKSLQD